MMSIEALIKQSQVYGEPIRPYIGAPHTLESTCEHNFSLTKSGDIFTVSMYQDGQHIVTSKGPYDDLLAYLIKMRLAGVFVSTVPVKSMTVSNLLKDVGIYGEAHRPYPDALHTLESTNDQMYFVTKHNNTFKLSTKIGTLQHTIVEGSYDVVAAYLTTMHHDGILE